MSRWSVRVCVSVICVYPYVHVNYCIMPALYLHAQEYDGATCVAYLVVCCQSQTYPKFATILNYGGPSRVETCLCHESNGVKYVDKGLGALPSMAALGYCGVGKWMLPQYPSADRLGRCPGHAQKCESCAVCVSQYFCFGLDFQLSIVLDLLRATWLTHVCIL